MDLEDSSSSSSPLRFPTPPEKPAPAGKKRAAGRKETRHPVYRGVRRKNGGKWVCEVREPNKKTRIWLGTFPTPETAAVAHDVAALALRGDHTPLNFPAAAPRLPRPRSASHHDIQRAASEAARDFCPGLIRVSEEAAGAEIPIRVSGAAQDSVRVLQEREIVINSPEDCWSSNQSPTWGGDGAGKGDGFVDEEAVFNMPALLDSMAEGMLLTPLAMKKGFNWSQHDEEGVELELWVD